MPDFKLIEDRNEFEVLEDFVYNGGNKHKVSSTTALLETSSFITNRYY